MKSSASRCRLVSTVFFRKVGDEVYVRNVATGEDFLFNAEAAPVFSALHRGFRDDSPALAPVAPFLRQLVRLGLVEKDAQKVTDKPMRRRDSSGNAGGARRPSPDVASRAQETCRRTGHLWSAGLELTYRCNARCRHCYCDIPSEQTPLGELAESDWTSVIDQLARLGCMNVLVTGGEPTLHPAFLSVCRRIIEKGMLCDLYTNGIDIPDALFDALCDLPLNSVSVSLYSGADAFHDEITGVPGSFRKTLFNLLRFKAAGFDAYAKTPLFHEHLEDFFAARKLGDRLHFPVQPANILVPGHSGSSRDAMMLDEREYAAFLASEPPLPTGTEAGHESDVPDSPICQAGCTTLCVTPFGKVRPCNSFPCDCGDVREAPLSRIWKTSPQFRRLRSLRRRDLSPQCAICADIGFCTVCPGAAWNETGGGFAPCSWSCKQAAIRASSNNRLERIRQ